jgi:hypothetical protein
MSSGFRDNLTRMRERARNIGYISEILTAEGLNELKRSGNLYVSLTGHFKALHITLKMYLYIT